MTPEKKRRLKKSLLYQKSELMKVVKSNEETQDFLNRHLKKIKELNEKYRPLEAGDVVEVMQRIYTKKTGAIKAEVGDKAFIRGIRKEFAWIFLDYRKTAIRIHLTKLKRWSNAEK